MGSGWWIVFGGIVGGVWVVVMLVFMLAGVVCLVVIIVLCGGEPTNIMQQLWSFLFLVSCVSCLRFGRFLPFERRSFTTIHKVILVVNSV